MLLFVEFTYSYRVDNSELLRDMHPRTDESTVVLHLDASPAVTYSAISKLWPFDTRLLIVFAAKDPK